jgi:hypothetical protein
MTDDCQLAISQPPLKPPYVFSSGLIVKRNSEHSIVNMSRTDPGVKDPLLGLSACIFLLTIAYAIGTLRLVEFARPKRGMKSCGIHRKSQDKVRDLRRRIQGQQISDSTKIDKITLNPKPPVRLANRKTLSTSSQSVTPAIEPIKTRIAEINDLLQQAIESNNRLVEDLPSLIFQQSTKGSARPSIKPDNFHSISDDETEPQMYVHDDRRGADSWFGIG